MNNDNNIPSDVIGYFFNRLVESEKYAFELNNDDIIIFPRINNKKDYDNKIIINDIDKLEQALKNYINSIMILNKNNKIDLSLDYFVTELIYEFDYLNDDLITFINQKCISLGSNVEFNNNIIELDDKEFNIKHINNTSGLFGIYFIEKNNKKNIELPLINYVNDNNTCYIVSLQSQNNNLILPQHNSALSLALFLKILDDNNVNNIIIPSTLVKKHQLLTNDKKSKEIAVEIINIFTNILQKLNLTYEDIKSFGYKGEEKYYYIKTKKLNIEEVFKASKTL